MIELVKTEHPALRETAKEIPIEQINSPEIRKVLDDMQQVLLEQEDGVAIAAPQIGLALSIFIVSKRVYMIDDDGYRIDLSKDEISKLKDEIYINPVLLKKSKKTKMLSEGCLSVRWQYGKVKRSTQATVRAYDENGKLFTKGGSGLMAQIFQHETDHLKGVLFTDTAINLEKIQNPNLSD